MSSVEKRFSLPKRFTPCVESLWEDYMELGEQYRSVDLAQGFPDYIPATYLAINALRAVCELAEKFPYVYQYTKKNGHPKLVYILANLYSSLIGRALNAESEILTTLGGYEALFISIVGNVEEGDEVIVIEPFYELYSSLVIYAGGIPKFVPLRLKKTHGIIQLTDDWQLDAQELCRAFNRKTKIIILNNPNNPLGKVYTIDELTVIAELCQLFNVICISDEAYEWLIYDTNVHIRMATMPGMWNRTITIGSASKSFGVTGWRVGWVYCAANLMVNLQTVHRTIVHGIPTPLQEAAAFMFEVEMNQIYTETSYFVKISRELQEKRNFMVQVFIDNGMKPTVPKAGYFMIVDWSALSHAVDLSLETDRCKDYRFTKWMIKNVRVTGIPMSAFYSEENKSLGENFVRFCFFKRTDSLNAAAIFLKTKINYVPHSMLMS